MRYRHPKSEGGANGIYGGIGSRPAPETWVPGAEDAASEDEPVPRRLRKIRLRRSRTPLTREDEMSFVPGWLLLAFFLFAMFAGLALVFLT
jgi:hypothetical protein